ncbi:MAG TPA: hypothetical protein VGT40_19110 [Methylomirabilota bacterium]|jgi:hypothetical protein|nr:hypothetical protein [Methylomirabilota bacterium]
MMKLRELKRGTSRAWPPTPAGSYGSGDKFGDSARAVLKGAALQERERQLHLDLEIDSGKGSAVLKWTAPPSLRQVLTVLTAHVGRPLAELGDLEVGGLLEPQLRARIHERIHEGGAPREVTTVSPLGIEIGSGISATCDACGEDGAEMNLPCEGWPTMRFHDLCFTIHAEEVQRYQSRGK